MRPLILALAVLSGACSSFTVVGPSASGPAVCPSPSPGTYAVGSLGPIVRAVELCGAVVGVGR